MFRHKGFDGINDFFSTLGDNGSGVNVLIMFILTMVLFAGLVFISVKFGKKNNNSFSKNSKIAIIGVFSALAFLMMFIGIPIIPNYNYLKVEVSLLVILMVSLVIDLKSGILVAIITAILDYLVKGSEAGVPINQILYFVATTTFLIVSYLGLQSKKLKKLVKNELAILVISTLAAAAATTIIMLVVNYFWGLPFYFVVVYGMSEEVATGVIKDTIFKVYGVFNLIKWFGMATLVIIMYNPLKRVVKSIEGSL